jgi:2-keto-4-pentenoate hydratase/2-oxohepta-3-ene-1,7-dioic acid hydratase in catechol pathway
VLNVLDSVFVNLTVLVGAKFVGRVPMLTTRSNLRDLRWSPGQMVAHLASSGCGLNTGDLLGTGTISSPVSAPHTEQPFICEDLSVCLMRSRNLPRR